MQTDPFFSSSGREKRWVKHISRNYYTINLKTRPCIFQVSQKLRDEKPEAYTPQALGLGPYHHLRPELQEMESLKRASVKAFLGVKNFIQSEDDVPLKFETENGILHSEILPHYDTYVDLDSNTLVWILVIDGIFLLQFLKEKKNWEDRRKVADLMMLENQMPMALLEEINKRLNDNSFPAVLNKVLLDQFEKFCDRHTPLKLSKERRSAAFDDKKHLLHFLYTSIVENFTTETPTPSKSTRGCGDLFWAILESLGFTKEVADNFTSAMGGARDRGLRLPQPINYVSKLLEQLQKTSDQYGNGDKILQQRLAQEIDVPSVSQLHVIAKINFACTGGVRNISFGKDTLYLPEIKLGETSEIILRNLVAYEAATKPAGSILELKEYVDLIMVHSRGLRCHLGGHRFISISATRPNIG